PAEPKAVAECRPGTGKIYVGAIRFKLDVEVSVAEQPHAVARAVLRNRARFPGALGIAGRAVAAQRQAPAFGHRPGVARAEHEIAEGLVILPHYIGHRVKLSSRISSGSDARAPSVFSADYNTFQCIQRYWTAPCGASRTASGARVPP